MKEENGKNPRLILLFQLQHRK